MKLKDRYYDRKYKYKYNYYGGESESRSGLCGEMSFTAAEAYKMLRTKLNLILPGGGNFNLDASTHTCRIIGVTSAMAGDGKTTTSINLAYSIAETGQKVCLLEADMRLPNIAKRLDLLDKPGLSNVLTGQCNVGDSIQKYVGKYGSKMTVISSGDVPPMPSELLGSANMKSLLAYLAEIFDAIIVDLPPVSVVTDALSVSPWVTGMVVVVRENYCDKRILKDVMYQFEQTGTKILGIVFNGANESAGAPVKYKHYYRHYYKNYSSRYQNARTEKNTTGET